jgi:hypothetical protein
MYKICQAKTKKDIIDFVKFPFKLYKNHPYWVPPIINDEVNYFNPELNLLLKKVYFKLILVKKGEEIVGRAAIIINWDEVNHLNKKNVRFGWFDVIDDLAVSQLILEEAEHVAREHQLSSIEGPIGFTNLDKVGLITEGFDELGSMSTWYNYPYYVEHLKKLGLESEKSYIQSKFDFPKVLPESFVKANDMIKRRYHLKNVEIKSTDDILKYTDQIFDLFNQTYSRLKSFVPISDEQKDFLKKQFIPFINFDYIKLVVDQNDKLIAFAITMPSFAEALRKANGKLFPFGFLYLLHAKKHSKNVEFLLISIDEAYQNKGVIAIVFYEMQKSFSKLALDKCYNTPILEDNMHMLNQWKHFNPIIFRKRATFVKKLTE